MALDYSFYKETEQKEWDSLIEERGRNGVFLQTRRFIEYHPADRFRDCSVCVKKGNELVAVILACEIEEEGWRIFFAHKGTTFGGITLVSSIYNATLINELIDGLLVFLRKEGFKKIYLKMVPDIYQKCETNLLDYFLYKNGFQCYDELNYYLELSEYREDVIKPFSSSKRRDYRYSLKSGFEFRRLDSREEIAEYYKVLLLNLQRLNLPIVHTLDELYDIKFNRFDEKVEFYGVYQENQMAAGSMLFYFGEDIVHTQYLSSDEKYLKLFPMDYLIANLIQVAVDKKMRLFSFGICTEDQGRYLNLGLSRFKEGFGTKFCINRSYEKVLD